MQKIEWEVKDGEEVVIRKFEGEVAFAVTDAFGKVEGPSISAYINVPMFDLVVEEPGKFSNWFVELKIWRQLDKLAEEMLCCFRSHPKYQEGMSRFRLFKVQREPTRVCPVTDDEEESRSMVSRSVGVVLMADFEGVTVGYPEVLGFKSLTRLPDHLMPLVENAMVESMRGNGDEKNVHTSGAVQRFNRLSHDKARYVEEPETGEEV